MTAMTLEDAIERNHAALDAMLKGDCSGYVTLLSDRDDVTWGNPFGPFARGRANVESTLASAATRMQGGDATSFDDVAMYRAQDLAVVVQVEHGQRKGADDQPPIALRVTSVYRLEHDDWRLVHRHADPITTLR